MTNQLTSRAVTVDGNIIGYVDTDGTPWLEQDFNPATHLEWESESEALAWADAWIAEYNKEGSN